MPGSDTFHARLRRVKLLVLDVDGVLTDNSVVLTNVDEFKAFSSLDGHGIRMLVRNGVRVAIITGRRSLAVERRAAELGIEADDVYQDKHSKTFSFRDLLTRHGIEPDEALFIGDDLPDLPPMRLCGVVITVPNAAEELLERADYVTCRPGGKGAVREVGDMILKAQGKWDEEMRRYLEDE